MQTWIRTLSAAGLLAAVAAPAAAEHLAGVAYVIDGDTLAVGGVAISLAGMDAPELDQTCRTEAGETWHCGLDARAFLAALAHQQVVECDVHERDERGERVGRCLRPFGIADVTLDLGEEMVGAGYAAVPPKAPSNYRDAERKARQEKLGIWLGPFTAPWDWRRGREH
ncbi:MAG: thermonuclease family protein [Alphaproteobacteria bacterium]|nr:thermonuclease family protein [Alphaproteobacteria bacterium]